MKRITLKQALREAELAKARAQAKVKKMTKHITVGRTLNVAASGAGVGAGALIEGFVDGRGYKPPLPMAAILGGLVAGLSLTDVVPEAHRDQVLLAGTGMMSVPIAQELYGKTYSWAAKGRTHQPAAPQPAPAQVPPGQGQVAGHVGYAPPAMAAHAAPHYALPAPPHAYAPLPLQAYGHHPPAPVAALPAPAPADALARQLYALAA